MGGIRSSCDLESLRAQLLLEVSIAGGPAGGAIFDDPNKAANHINRYWDNLSDWWDDINVKKSRTLFLKKFKLNQNSYCEFINCFKKINLV